MDENRTGGQGPAGKKSEASGPLHKVYYTISEVAELAELKQYVLRFWESEFPHLHPKTSRGGHRQYRIDDIKLVLMIKKLLYQDGYTIDGARKKLKEIKENDYSQMEIPFNNLNKKMTLTEITRELKDVLSLLS